MRRRAAALLLALAGCHTRHVLGEVDGADGGASDLPPPLQPCGAFVAGPDFRPCTATFVGGAGAEPTPAVGIGAGGAVVVATGLEGTDLGASPRALLGGGSAAVVRLRPDGRQVLSVTRLGAAIHDLEIEPGRQRILVLGAPFGVAALSPEGDDVLWSRPAAGTRLGVGADGTIAVLDAAAGQVAVFAPDGSPRGAFALKIDGAQAADLAVHAGSRTIAVGGAVPVTSLQQPFLSGYGYAGESKWRNYGWRDEVIARRLMASSRIVRVAVGLDDRLYAVGDSHGGNTTFKYNPRSLDEVADLLSYDEFNQAYGTGTYIVFLGRYRPDTGLLERGQFLLARNPPEPGQAGQATLAGAIAADERGTILVAGRLRCCIEDQSKKTVAGERLVSATGAEDAFALMISADLRRRLLWTTFGRGGPSEATGVAVARGVAAMVAVQDRAATSKPLITTPDAVQPRPGGGASDAYLTVWPAP